MNADVSVSNRPAVGVVAGADAPNTSVIGVAIGAEVVNADVSVSNRPAVGVVAGAVVGV